MKRKIFGILFTLVLVLSLSLVMAVPAGATLPGASTAPTATAGLGETNALVMDFTINDGGDILVAGIAPSAGTATADGEDGDWAIDSYDKTNTDAWDNVNDLLAIDDDADNDYTAQADQVVDADGKGAAVGGAVADDGGVTTDETTAANEATADDMTLLPAVPVVNDAYYFGHANQFDRVLLDISTAGAGVWTITWEYYNGTTWSALAGVSDGTSDFTVAGESYITFTLPGDWAQTTVGVIANLYWVRGNVSAYTSVTTQPLGKQAWIGAWGWGQTSDMTAGGQVSAYTVAFGAGALYYTDTVTANVAFDPGEDVYLQVGGVAVATDTLISNGSNSTTEAWGTATAFAAADHVAIEGADATYTDGEDIVIDYHDGGTYSAAADTFVAGTTPADGTSYTSDNAFDADWDMDSIDAVDGGAWDSGADAIIVDTDTNDAYRDQLNAITLQNTGTAVDTTDIAAVKVWAEEGTTAGFQAVSDTPLGSATWDTINSWDLSALTTDIPATDQRVYVTVDIAAAADVGDTIIMQVPTLADAGTGGAYDAGDEGLFFASTDDIGGITNGNTQTITAGPIDHYAVSTITSPRTAWIAFNVTIQAQDQYNNNITTGGDAAETVNITFGLADSGATPRVTTTTDGTVTVAMRMTVAQAGQTITFVGVTSGETGISTSFNVASPSIGGGWAPPTPTIETNLFGKVSRFRFHITTRGEIREMIQATSGDGMLTMTIPKGTIALDKNGKPLSTLTSDVDVSPPPPPSHIIGLAYDFGPDGATFDPAITLTWNYDPDALPEGVAEEDLVIAYYAEEAGEWVECDFTRDPETHCVMGYVCHFTTFAIIAHAAPAAFSASNLSIQPAEVQPEEAVTITLSVANTGGTEGSYAVVLKINDVKEAEKDVTIAAGSSQSVTFSVTKEKAGSYSVDVNGLSGSFTVKEKPAPTPAPPPAPPPEVTPPFNWPVIGGIIAVVVVVGLLIFFLVVRRRAH